MTTSGDPGGLDPAFVALLACPACDERPPVEVIADGAYLRCTVCDRRYPVADGIPVMLVDAAVSASASER